MADDRSRAHPIQLEQRNAVARTEELPVRAGKLAFGVTMNNTPRAIEHNQTILPPPVPMHGRSDEQIDTMPRCQTADDPQRLPNLSRRQRTEVAAISSHRAFREQYDICSAPRCRADRSFNLLEISGDPVGKLHLRRRDSPGRTSLLPSAHALTIPAQLRSATIRWGLGASEAGPHAGLSWLLAMPCRCPVLTWEAEALYRSPSLTCCHRCPRRKPVRRPGG